MKQDGYPATIFQSSTSTYLLDGCPSLAESRLHGLNRRAKPFLCFVLERRMHLTDHVVLGKKSGEAEESGIVHRLTTTEVQHHPFPLSSRERVTF